MRLAPGADVDAAQERSAIRTRLYDGGVLTAAVSRSHLDAQTQALLARWPEAEHIASGSAIKLCWVADGTVHLYPRLAPVREWDLAAGQAIVEAAGGSVRTPASSAVLYGRSAENFLVPGFVACADSRVADALFL
jgi:3'(2'), 5'-bisphosphate nucleotidase